MPRKINNIFVTGNGTNIGKTFVAAVIASALKADYWKPIQTGTDEGYSDTALIKKLCHQHSGKVHQEVYSFPKAVSPHEASLPGEIDFSKLIPPKTDNLLVIEGAGGVLVPINSTHLVIDLITELKSPVIFVSQFYLGSINHTLLSLEALKARDIPVLGILFNGQRNPRSEEAILNFSEVPKIAEIPLLAEIDSNSVQACAQKIRPALQKVL